MAHTTGLQFRVLPATTRPSTKGTVLFTHTLCPYAERAWLALLEKGSRFDLVHVDLSNKPSWYRQVNPRGLVPAVQHEGIVHVESLDICRWADEALEGPALMPSDPALRAEAERLIDGADSFVSAGLDLMAGRTGRFWGIGSGQTASQRKTFEAELAPLHRSLQRHGGPFLVGEQATVADLVYFPFARRFQVGMQRFCGYDMAEALGGSVGRWLSAMGQRPSCQVSSADDDALLRAYERHLCLDFFDYDPYSVFQLHPQNGKYLEASE